MNTGTVTFLFTDIEGSTKLAQEFAVTYQNILQRHDDILRQAIESNNGKVFKKIGDSFCSSFNNPEDAVKAAIDIQKNLTLSRDKGFDVKVRMGIHSGEAEFVDDDYMGYVTLSRVQRIMSIAHGGQILITQEVRDALKNNFQIQISFKDFGKRKLKDIILPEHVYQIVADGLQPDFPQLKSLDARQNNLPTSVTNFVGRNKEIEEIKKMFQKSRLISLTGTGGTGKTRLAIKAALEVIDEFENGVWLVELSPITNPDLIVKEISTVLNLKEDPGHDIFDTLKEFLKEKKILLILDNCEHLLSKCAPIAETLLSTCPKLIIISTTREPFNIHGENIYRVPPMSMPENIRNKSFEDLAEFESVKLFLDRAKSVNPNFELTGENIYPIAELCKKLDGIPLAIELASKRVNVLSVEKILERLDDRFKLLTGGSSTAMPRQKTLKALIDWSYDMLSPNEQLLLQRLAAFMGGWTLEATEEICSDDEIDQYEVMDIMNGLLDKSLIMYNEVNGKERYGMLESIKYYALEKLPEKTSVFEKHLQYFLNLSSFLKQKEKGIGQLEWLNLMDAELDNIRANIQRAAENNPEDTARLVINTFDFWFNKGYLQEGFESSKKIIDSINIADKKLKADLLYRIARFCYVLGKFDELEKFSSEALDLYREINDRQGILKSLNALALKPYIKFDNAATIKLNEEALEISKQINSKEDEAATLYNLSFPVGNLGEFDKSISLKEKALKLSKEAGNEHLTAQILLSLSISQARRRGDIKKASLLSEESLATSRKIEDQNLISMNLVNLGALKLYYENKNFDEAEYILLEAYKISNDCGYTMNLFPIRVHLGVIYTETGKYSDAIKIYNEYLNEREKPGGDFFINDIIAGFGEIFILENEFDKAALVFGFAENHSKETNHKSLNKYLPLSEQLRNELIDKLGREKFELHWNKGQVMKPDEVLNFILTSQQQTVGA